MYVVFVILRLSDLWYFFLQQIDLGDGVKPAGYYVQRSCGLFPAPLPQEGPIIEKAEQHFHMMGIFFAKCLQDQRLIDLPLSKSFLKMLCQGVVLAHATSNHRKLGIFIFFTWEVSMCGIHWLPKIRLDIDTWV